MITLLGVGHVFDLESAIRAEIHRRRPRVVGLELDPRRFAALRQRGPSRGGPLAYRLLALFQRMVAGQEGTEVGQEMLQGAQAAQEVGAVVAFLDLDGAYIWRRLWSTMSTREKTKLLLGVLTGMVAGRSKVDVELEKYSANPTGYIEIFAKEFPSVKRVLLDERNDHMAGALRALHAQHQEVLAIVGDGHVDGLLERLRGEAVEAVRLWELKAQPMASHTMTFSFDLKTNPPPKEP
jgi:pheromone shutdown protein TraB